MPYSPTDLVGFFSFFIYFFLFQIPLYIYDRMIICICDYMIIYLYIHTYIHIHANAQRRNKGRATGREERKALSPPLSMRPAILAPSVPLARSRYGYSDNNSTNTPRPRFGIGKGKPGRAAALAPPTIHLFHFQFNFRIAFHFRWRFTWRTAIAFTHSVWGMMRLVKRSRLRRSGGRETKKYLHRVLTKAYLGIIILRSLRGRGTFSWVTSFLLGTVPGVLRRLASGAVSEK